MVKEAHTKEDLDKILMLRYTILRAPWQQPFESATDELESRSVNAFISDSHNTVIACGRLQENENKTGQIRYMAVDEKYRGQGLGKLILGFLENKARTQHFQKIQLQARQNALEFYKSQGYQLKEKTFLLWGKVQHYLMERQL